MDLLQVECPGCRSDLTGSGSRQRIKTDCSQRIASVGQRIKRDGWQMISRVSQIICRDSQRVKRDGWQMIVRVGKMTGQARSMAALASTHQKP
jgi:hypothetical protein